MKCKTGKIDLASNVEFEDACTDCPERFGCETCKDKFMETDENNCFEDCENCERENKETECEDFGCFPPKDECSGICHICPRNLNCDFKEGYDDNCDEECEGCDQG